MGSRPPHHLHLQPITPFLLSCAAIFTCSGSNAWTPLPLHTFRVSGCEPVTSQRVDLPPGTKPFRISFSSDHAGNLVTVNLDVHSGDYVQECARNVVATLHGEGASRPDVEKLVCEEIRERLEVFRSEDHRRYNPHEHERPVFSLGLDDGTSLPFYEGDSVQFGACRARLASQCRACMRASIYHLVCLGML